MTNTGTTHITLRTLQDRRSFALELGDWPAYWAFDAMIGQVLGCEDIYKPVNAGIQAAREDEARRLEKAAAEDQMVADYVAEGLGEWTDFCHADDAARERQS